MVKRALKIKIINVALDGPSGVGKSTVGKELAKQLNYHFLDSGLLYRHFAQFYLQTKSKEINFQVLKEWQKLIQNKEKLITQLEQARSELNSAVLSQLASQLSPHPELRKIICSFQQELTKNKGWVVVGRDITSQVLPQTEIKIFLTASLAARVQRRSQQTKNNLNEVVTDLEQRDYRDQNRPIAPLQKTADSWELDTTHLSLYQSVQAILDYIHQTLNF